MQLYVSTDAAVTAHPAGRPRQASVEALVRVQSARGHGLLQSGDHQSCDPSNPDKHRSEHPRDPAEDDPKAPARCDQRTEGTRAGQLPGLTKGTQENQCPRFMLAFKHLKCGTFTKKM
ncbi:hypothetical protein NDU88_003854 [Pleurodeles waltl]|uniref:Uncharacterized protein n=1 Tax=Pleurodeles waltl TaxID=8319 RepID=A0AAV7V189_PLEWA|nr:hypothetical protein NDU88_003854 [Pleurodeles waltl]